MLLNASIAQKKEDEKMAQVPHVASVASEKKKERVVHILERCFELRKCACEKMSVLLLRLVRFWGEKNNQLRLRCLSCLRLMVYTNVRKRSRRYKEQWQENRRNYKN